MACEYVKLPGGQTAIVCGTRGKRPIKCSACGKAGDRLCDWKMPAKKSGTCDKPICKACAHKPARGKDLCPAHAAEWLARCTKQRGCRCGTCQQWPLIFHGDMPVGRIID